MVKADCLKPNPQMDYFGSHRYNTWHRCFSVPRFYITIEVSSTGKTSINEILQGDVWATYGELGRIRLTEHGITYGRKPMVALLVRVTPHQGRREGRLQGEAAQVWIFFSGRARDVPILNLWNISAGEPHDTETCAMSRIERIATEGGRSSRQKTPRRPTLPRPEREREQEHDWKAGKSRRRVCCCPATSASYG
jgi:hypothetical protein